MRRNKTVSTSGVRITVSKFTTSEVRKTGKRRKSLCSSLEESESPVLDDSSDASDENDAEYIFNSGQFSQYWHEEKWVKCKKCY